MAEVGDVIISGLLLFLFFVHGKKKIFGQMGGRCLYLFVLLVHCLAGHYSKLLYFTLPEMTSMIGFLLRIVFYSAAWWGLAAGALDSWQIGLPFIAASIYVDYLLSRPVGIRWSPVAWLIYGLYFFRFSITGGLDVLRRIYHPRLPLKPGMIAYPLKLSSLSARKLFVCTVSLLPGTLSVQLSEQDLKIHVLDTDGPYRHELDIIEQRVAALFHSNPVPDQAGGS